jgi:hypothetical protein
MSIRIFSAALISAALLCGCTPSSVPNRNIVTLEAPHAIPDNDVTGNQAGSANWVVPLNPPLPAGQN